MTIVITRSGKGSAISEGENDNNLDSMCGINEAQAATSYTVVAADQNRTIECSNASPIAITLDAIATIVAAIDTSDFDVTIKNVGAGAVTITPNVADAIDNGSSTIVLAQYEYVTLQTDSTHAIWNIINGNYDVVTETGTQTLSDKTHTDPVLNGTLSGTAFLDEDDMLSDSDIAAASQQSIKAYADAVMAYAVAKTAALNKKVIDIGDWNMDSTASTTVTHGVTLSKIRRVGVVIRHDADNLYYDAIQLNTGCYYNFNATVVTITRVASGAFDSTSFDSTSYNRGWVVIEYTD